MDAVVMAGGLGTRLMPLTVSVPKPLLPLGDRPIIDVVLSQLTAHGFDRVYLCIGHLAGLFREYLGSGERWKIDIRYVIEESPQGTAGGLRQIPALSEDFMVINGDTLTDLDFSAFMRFHCEQEAGATLFTPWIENKIEYGVVTFDDSNGRVTGYDEKPSRGFYASSGIYALASRMLRLLPSSGRFDMPDLIQAALTRGEKILAYQCPAYWQDIGLISHYEKADREYQKDPKRFVR